MIIAFRAEKYKSLIDFFVVFVSHLIAGLCSLSDLIIGGDNVGCTRSVYFLIVVIAFDASYVVFDPMRSLKNIHTKNEIYANSVSDNKDLLSDS